MYKGTYEGDSEEIKFVAKFNSNKLLFKDYLSEFEQKISNLWMIRVTTKQLSALNNKKVFTRADSYLSFISSNIDNLLKTHDYYLSEDILEKNNIQYDKIHYSGISIKMDTSHSFQILKLGPHSFNSLFNSYELGAGASLFCINDEDLKKNIDLISGWNSTIELMVEYFKEYVCDNNKFYLDKDICRNIKNFSCNEITRRINNSVELQKKIFNGIGLYQEPYTAHFFYHENKLSKLNTLPFNVTTGSGRTKGNYTIVLKPK